MMRAIGASPKARGFLFSHHDQCCGPVVTGRRIAHGQDAVFLKGRLEVAHLLQIDPIRFLIVCDGLRVAPFRCGTSTGTISRLKAPVAMAC